MNQRRSVRLIYIHAYISTVTKTVALSDEAYDALSRLKTPGQSFSELVKQLVAERRPRIRDVAGLVSADAAHWQRYAKERSKARQTTRRRVELDG